MSHPDLPRLPRSVALFTLPLAPLSLFLTQPLCQVVTQHPGMLKRRGQNAGQSFLLDLTDMPFLLLMEPGPSAVKLTAHLRRRSPPHDARIAGLTSAFLGMMHGSMDGDALFFSRDLVIEGDTSAALALRNAIDDAELDMAAEITRIAGPLFARLVPQVERITGLALHRMGVPAEGFGI